LEGQEHPESFSANDCRSTVKGPNCTAKTQNRDWLCGMATHEWFDFIKNDPPLLHGIVKSDRLIVFGGGYAIKTEAGIIGGIGVSGGHYSDDMKVAQAGLE